MNKQLLTTTLLLTMTAAALPQEGNAPQVVHLWSGGAPGFEDRKNEPENVKKKGDIESQVTNVHNPSVTVYLPAKDKATGAGVIVCAGGGHSVLNVGGEGHAVARWLADNGIAAFVLKYRLAREKGSPYKIDTHALQDGQRAIRLVRHNAKDWNVDPARIGMMGFSAGGEVVALASTRFDQGKDEATDPVERQGCRPARDQGRHTDQGGTARVHGHWREGQPGRHHGQLSDCLAQGGRVGRIARLCWHGSRLWHGRSRQFDVECQRLAGATQRLDG
jgi:hypothetical protein